MLLSYGIPRAMQSLTVNWRASLNSMLIISASLSVLGAGVLLYLNVIYFSHLWLSNTTISLFLRPGLIAEERANLLERVRGDSLVVTAEMVTPKEGLKLLGAKLGADHGLLAGVDEAELPYTIDFELSEEDRSGIHAAVAKFVAFDGVDEVVYAERSLASVRLFFTVTQGVGLFFIGFVLLSFFMIVSNSVKLSLHTRLDEIEILAAVGATDRAIRASFVIEGMILSMAGYLVALVIVWLGHSLVIAALTWNEATMVLKTRALFLPGDLLAISFVLAVAIGGMASHFSVTRLLRDIR